MGIEIIQQHQLIFFSYVIKNLTSEIFPRNLVASIGFRSFWLSNSYEVNVFHFDKGENLT